MSNFKNSKPSDFEFGINNTDGSFGYFFSPIADPNYDQHLEIDHLFPSSMKAHEVSECLYVFGEVRSDKDGGKNVTAQLTSMGFTYNSKWDNPFD